MNLTTNEAVEVMRSRLGGMLQQAVNMTKHQEEPSVLSALAWACRRLKATVADANSVTDTELAAMDDNLLDPTLDLCEIRLIRNLQGAMPATNVQFGPQRIELNNLKSQLESMLEDREGHFSARYKVSTTQTRPARIIVP